MLKTCRMDRTAGIADFINGKVVVPAQPSAAENAAAVDFAARLGFGSTGLTPPLVVNADSGSGPRIWIGRATPASESWPKLDSARRPAARPRAPRSTRGGEHFAESCACGEPAF